MSKRKTNQQPIKEVFKDLLKIYGMEEKYTSAEIRGIYESFMGPAVAKQTKKIEFYNGILSIYLNSAVLKNEFSYGKDKIKKMINKELGQKAVKEVRIF